MVTREEACCLLLVGEVLKKAPVGREKTRFPDLLLHRASPMEMPQQLNFLAADRQNLLHSRRLLWTPQPLRHPAAPLQSVDILLR